ncbi:MAG TPA: DNA polymerase I [Candidatus Acidoferrales bacterium]|nr:DNA polymerase I [Candidatus Acidoferrales bacterium]
MAAKRFFILDGTALAYRAYFAMISHPLINSKGQNTSAAFGFANYLMKIIGDEKPDYLVAVFDTGEPTFRHKEYPEYKATREKMPEEMIGQLAHIKRMLNAFGVPTLEKAGYEADDLIGTLAQLAAKENIDVFMVTGDKDFMQLVTPRIKMYKPGKSGMEVEIVDEKGVEKKFGVKPSQVIDVMALTGDAVDNVPGIKGIGDKTAIPLIQQYGTLEKLLASADKIEKPALQEKLKQGKNMALLSKKLVTIKTDVPLGVDFHSLKEKNTDGAEVTKIFNELEFRSLIKRAQQMIPAPSEKTKEPAEEEKETAGEPSVTEVRFEDGNYKDVSSVKHSYKLITDLSDLQKLVEKLKKSEFVSMDTETTGTNALLADLVGISLSVKPREAYYVSVASDGGDLFSGGEARRGVSVKDAVKLLKPIFESSKIKKVGQNLKYDMLILSNYGVTTQGVAFDSMVAAYVVSPDGQHNLDALAKEYLGYKPIAIEELIGKGKNQINMSEVSPEVVAEYSGEDADVALQLRDVLQKKLEKSNLLGLCEKVEFPLIEVLAEVERTGVKIDTEILGQISKELERMIENLGDEVYKLAGEEFNINSPKQLGEILFKKMKIAPTKKTKTGYSTDVFVLEELGAEHPIAEKILTYRKVTKLKSTYVDVLPTLINPRTGRVHTSFNQTVAATGRLSSADPNLQNIPIRGEMGKEIRKAFVPGEKGWVMVSADYSQIELRIMAHICKDEGLIDAFNKHEDIHRTTASKVFGVPTDEVTSDMRRKAKEVNFGLLYGIGPYGLKIRLGISQGEAKDVIDTYFRRFPRVREYINSTLEFARKHGYVETLLGRRRYLANINSKNSAVRMAEERQAINMPIQGTAADMIKLAMIAIHHEMKKKDMKSRMLLQVHDELVFESPKSEVKELEKLVTDRMKTAMKLSVPVDVEVGTGPNWLDAH